MPALKKNVPDPVQIVKKALREPIKDVRPSFPPLPMLYLELFENKNKIKQDLINKDYVPQQVVSHPTASVKKDVEEAFTPPSKKEDDSISISESDKEKTKADTHSESESGSDTESVSDTESESDSEPDVKLKKDDDSESESGSDSDSDNSISESVSQKNSVSERLLELLGDKKSIETKPSRFTPYKDHLPPSLKELEKQGQYQPTAELRNINQISSTEVDEEDKKRDLLFKFDMLRQSNPLAQNIPEFSLHSNLHEMQKEYDNTVKKLHLTSTVESYKKYMIGGFALVEYVLGNYMGFDMQGFTQQQIMSMNSYEKLLIEMGEKSYVPTGSKWPVELRLMFLVIINAGFFIVGKMLMKKTGSDFLTMMNNTVSPPAPEKPKRKMRGPNIDLENLPSE